MDAVARQLKRAEAIIDIDSRLLSQYQKCWSDIEDLIGSWETQHMTPEVSRCVQQLKEVMTDATRKSDSSDPVGHPLY